MPEEIALGQSPDKNLVRHRTETPAQFLAQAFPELLPQPFHIAAQGNRIAPEPSRELESAFLTFSP